MARKTQEDGSGEHPWFVIQKHDATRLHYDLRLEVDGVLKSWAVPKGPSTNPTDKRLAVQTDDHSFDYLDFEGVIGEQRYGSGAVIVWDIGQYPNINQRDGEPIQMADAIDAGHLKFWLDGVKVTGGYALTRTDDEPGGQWLLVKIRDRAADARGDLTVSRPESVLSGRTIEDLAADAGG